MAKRLREFVDKDHEVMDAYYDLREKYNGKNGKTIKKKLQELTVKDPDFFDTSLFLFEILQNEGKLLEAEAILESAYQRAVKLITDKRGNWPDILEWGWLENRHIIRTILNKAIALWIHNETDGALELFRKLLKTNPGDNVGVRDFILAIRMNMSFAEFENRFDKGGYYDTELTDCFDENYQKFPDEFDWWEKAVEKYL